MCVCVNAKGKVNYSLYSIYLFVGALGRPRGCSTVMVGPSGTRVFMVIIAHFKVCLHTCIMFSCTYVQFACSVWQTNWQQTISV